MYGLILFLSIAFLIILDAIAAAKFNRIASEKGYSGYFWWCFLLGPCGWTMVIALPDRGRRAHDYTEQLQALQTLLGDVKTSIQTNTPAVSEDSLPEL